MCVYVHTDAYKDQELEAEGIYRKIRDLIWVLGIEFETSTRVIYPASGTVFLLININYIK